MPSNASEQRQRLFFALWPDEAVRAALHEFAQSAQSGASGRVTARANLHLTLAFAGSVVPAGAECLMARAGTLNVPPFDLLLDQYGAFPQAGIAWLAPSEVPESLQALADELRGVLQACGAKNERRPFRPHVTLRRKVAPHKHESAEAGPPAACISWPVREFALVASSAQPAGSSYRVLHAWPLRPDA